MKCAPPFSLQGFPTFLVTYPHTVVLETLIDNVRLKFFYLSVFVELFGIYLQFFDNFSPTVCEKTTIDPLLGLSSKVFTFEYLFGHRSDFFNNLAIFWGLNGQKTIKLDA